MKILNRGFFVTRFPNLNAKKTGKTADSATYDLIGD